jgi:hypothetical protein
MQPLLKATQPGGSYIPRCVVAQPLRCRPLASSPPSFPKDLYNPLLRPEAFPPLIPAIFRNPYSCPRVGYKGAGGRSDLKPRRGVDYTNRRGRSRRGSRLSDFWSSNWPRPRSMISTGRSGTTHKSYVRGAGFQRVGRRCSGSSEELISHDFGDDESN